MIQAVKFTFPVSALLVALVLAGCGGGGGNGSNQVATASSAVAAPSVPSIVTADPGEPRLTNDVATDGFNWFNYRRRQMGESALTRNATIDNAALGHSNYQRINNTITHVQTVGKPGFTGAQVSDRLTASGYRFSQGSYAFGEVISSTGRTTGPEAAEGLIAAIYHRFAIFDPSFKEAGTATAATPSGYTYYTTDFTVNGLSSALGNGKFVVYPFADQQRVPVVFYSDFESPDPVPDLNEVGYPVSVHADITSKVTVQTFTIKPRNGAQLRTRLLTNALDRDTPVSAASIVPLDVLMPATTYDVQFAGSVDGIAVNRGWSFTTAQAVSSAAGPAP
ncbi:MAG: CAP domain-containing protein [Herminiimonas sp.]|nr:CAP domain-containing protein [Herminiimonas sp.]